MPGLPPEAAHGVLVVDKPEGPTSHDVVAVARRAMGSGRVGHAGTLDPMATGVLVLMLGAATRLARFLSNAPKSYDAVVTLGVETDSGDRTGSVVARAAPGTPWPDQAAVREALAGFLGTRDQLPPALSAKRVGGARAYSLARAGAEVPLRAAPVTLHEAEIRGYDPPELRLALVCSAGFYVRSLARDLGRGLGHGGCLQALRRTASAGFTLEHSVPLDLLVRAPAEAAARLMPLDRLLPELPAACLNEAGARKARHGNDLGRGDLACPAPAWAPGQAVRLLSPGGKLLGVAEPASPPCVLHPAVVLQ